MNQTFVRIALSPWTLVALALLPTALPSPALRRMCVLFGFRSRKRTASALLSRGLARIGGVRIPGIRSSRGEPAGNVPGLRLAASWDLLSACLAAGMPIPTAVRTTASTSPSHVERILLRSADLLTLGADPAQAWQQARECADTAELARAACRAARAGTALADVAANLARRAREAMSDRDHARSQRAGVLMAGPLCLCFLPAFLCLGVIPVVIGLAGQLAVLR